MSVIMAICTLGKVRAEWAVGLARGGTVMGHSIRPLLVEGMTTIEARNKAVQVARQEQADYLFFWDDDVIPHEADARVLLITALDENPEIDIIGGVYPARRSRPVPIVVERDDAGVYWGWRDGQIHPVYMTGTGFMAIRMSSLDRIPEERVFARTVNETDDFRFADLCRQYGVRQYVHGGVLCDQMNLDGKVFSLKQEPVWAEAV